ncbi:hypothetical protein [Jatrophihabitans endophyticus]|uniref:hypothetical protein n=1 Tax=Jatrophihabitans endophyticus TaxID=1206085 RepID=UPI00116140B3|nr:hypothetical protein [Jatrophihabitans endophyticus]
MTPWHHPATTDEVGSSDDLGTEAEQHGITLPSLYLAYVSLGGDAAEFEVDAYLHGFGVMPADDVTRLRHALWELVTF